MGLLFQILRCVSRYKETYIAYFILLLKIQYPDSFSMGLPFEICPPWESVRVYHTLLVSQMRCNGCIVSHLEM